MEISWQSLDLNLGLCNCVTGLGAGLAPPALQESAASVRDLTFAEQGPTE